METQMMLIVILWGLTAAILEAWNDRKGETKKDKIQDAVYLAVATSCLCLLTWVLDRTNPLKVIVLVLGVRVLAFDYIVHWFLKRNSESHKHINIWTYSGKTAFTDRLTGRVHPVVRAIVRVLAFALSIVWFLY